MTRRQSDDKRVSLFPVAKEKSQDRPEELCQSSTGNPINKKRRKLFTLSVEDHSKNILWSTTQTIGTYTSPVTGVEGISV